MRRAQEAQACLLRVDLVEGDAAARVRGAEAEVRQAGDQRQSRRQRGVDALRAARALRKAASSFTCSATTPYIGKMGSAVASAAWLRTVLQALCDR